MKPVTVLESKVRIGGDERLDRSYIKHERCAIIDTRDPYLQLTLK